MFLDSFVSCSLISFIVSGVCMLYFFMFFFVHVFSFFPVFLLSSTIFHFFSCLFVSFHFVPFFLLKKKTNPDHLQFDTLFSFADL